jgi:hypothetical protein
MRVENLLKQLKREFIKVKLLQSLLDGLLFFLLANLGLFLLNLSIVDIGAREISFGLFTVPLRVLMLGAAAVLVSAGQLYRRMQRYEVEVFEQENPELQEVLRTARDNLDQQNIVSQALFDDVLDRARRVSSDSIIPARQIIYKIMGVGILSFLTVMSGLADFQLDQSRDLLRTPDSIRDLAGGGGGNQSGQVRDLTGISGDSSELEIGDSEIEFEVSGEGAASGSGFDPTSGPSREELTLDSTAGQSTEDLELAKQYSLAVRDSG